MPDHAGTKRNQPPLGHLEKRPVSSHHSNCGKPPFDLHDNTTRAKYHKRVPKRRGPWTGVVGQ